MHLLSARTARLLAATVSRASWDTAKAVVMGAGILKVDVKYDEIIDMSYVDKFKSSL